MDLRKVLVQSRKLPAQHVEGLWEDLYRNNVKIDTLNAILAFYLHHRVYPPPVQKAFDTLLMVFTGTKVPRKLRTLLFQIVEEMCPWLSASCISDTVRLSSNTGIVANMLPCFLINKDIPSPEAAVYERLINSLSSPGLSQADRTKVLGFLMTTIPPEQQPMLNKLLVTWLSYSRTSQTSGSLFRAPDVTEIDGSPGLGICTVLTLVTTVTDLHVLSMVTFSNIRRYLLRSRECVDDALINAVFSYCSSLLAQATKKPSSNHDRQLIAAVMEEVVQVVRTVREVDPSCRGRCQLMVGNIHHLADQLRLTTLLLSVWEYHLSQGDESVLTERILGSVIKSEFSQGSVSQGVAPVVAAHSSRLATSLARHFPNLLKLVATHPSTMVEDFLDILPHLCSEQDLIVEVAHGLLDLPVLAATVCVHQTRLLVQAGFKVPGLLAVRQQVDSEHKAVYSHLMRSQALPGQTEPLLKLYSRYWSVLRPMMGLGLIEVCAQVTPLLLDSFLETVSNSPQVHRLLLPALLSRVPLVFPLSTYQKAVFDLLTQYVSKVCSLQPELLEDPAVLQFLSVSSYTQLCPQLYIVVTSAVGDHVNSESVVASCFETLDALLRELLKNRLSVDLTLESTIGQAIAKLASRHADLIPRAIAVFEKLSQSLQGPSEEKEKLLNQTKELIRVLKNPRLASVVLSPSTREDVELAALIKVLFKFLD